MPLKLYKNNKKPSPRKQTTQSTYREKTHPEVVPAEYGLRYNEPSFKLKENCHLKFVDGRWTLEGDYSLVSYSVIDTFKKEISQLKEENYFSRIKVQILLNMLAEMRVKYDKLKQERLHVANAAEED